MKNTTQTKLVELVKEFTGNKNITPETKFKDIKLKEYGFYELIFNIEEEMKTSISDDYANDIIDNPSEYKIQDLAKYIQNGIED